MSIGFLRRFRRRKQYVALRKKDGYGWMGPWKYNGRAFSAQKTRWYRWGSKQAALSAVAWDGWDQIRFGVEVVEYKPD